MANTHKEGSGSIKVLLIPPLLERNYEILFKHFRPEFMKLFTFYIIKPIPRHENGVVDYSALLDYCVNLVKEEDIGIVFANKQAGVLVWAVLCQKFSHIRGPSVESVFLSNHEYYKTVIVDAREQKIPFSLQYFGDDCYDFAFRVMTSVMPPCIIRPCLGIGHSNYKFHNRDELLTVANQCKLDTEHIIGMHSYLVSNFVDLKRYPMATARAVLLNSILDSPSTKVHIEACVFQKDVIMWALCDVINSLEDDSDAANKLSGLTMPSDLSSSLQEKVSLEFRNDIKNLIDRGLDYSFLHGEYDVYEDGFVHLVALCVGPNANNTKMYTQSMDMGNNMEAALQVNGNLFFKL